MLVEGAHGQHAAGGLAVPSRCGKVRDGAFEQISSPGEYLPIRVGLASQNRTVRRAMGGSTRGTTLVCVFLREVQLATWACRVLPRPITNLSLSLLKGYFKKDGSI